MSVEGFRDDGAIDGSLERVVGQWCSLLMIMMRAMAPKRGMYGRLDAEFEVQRRHQEGRVLVSSQKDCWSHHGSC